MSEPLLDVASLSVDLMTARGVVRAVDEVSFGVAEGETVTIIGESGSGKSTTAMALLRLLADDLAVLSGSATLSGVDVVGDPRGVAKLRGRAVALIPQDPMSALSPVHRVGRQLGQVVRRRRPELNRAAATARAVELLDAVRIPEPAAVLERYPHQLSGGMLQRVLIAVALATEARLLVADEPTSALDVTVQAAVLNLVLDLQEEAGFGMLLITHDIGVARMMSDRIHVMRRGRFVESGEVEQVVDAPRDPYTQQLIRAVPTLGEKVGQ